MILGILNKDLLSFFNLISSLDKSLERLIVSSIVFHSTTSHSKSSLVATKYSSPSSSNCSIFNFIITLLMVK